MTDGVRVIRIGYLRIVSEQKITVEVIRLPTRKLNSRNYLYNFPIGPLHQSHRVYFPRLDSDVFDSDIDFHRFEHRFSRTTS